MQIELSKILITDRQRLCMDEDHITRLMESFKDIGQVQAVLVNERLENHLHSEDQKQYSIVAGATRCTAALRLGWTHIRADIFDHTTSELKQQKAEYVENALRQNLPWQDQCLALARIHSLITNERALAGETWTKEMLAQFTGFAATPVKYMLRVALALQQEPRDEEVWTQTGYTTAFQVLLGRLDTEATQEIQRRKNEQTANAVVIEEAIIPIPLIGEDDELGEGLIEPSTQQAYTLPTNTAKICGNVTPKPGVYSLALHYQNDIDNWRTIHNALKPGGYLICIDNTIDDIAAIEHFNPLQELIWDVQAEEKSPEHHFSYNYCHIFVYQKVGGEKVDLHNPRVPGVITSFKSADGTLPIALVSQLTSVLCQPGEPVLNSDHSAIRALLELGHTPVWFEKDPVKFFEIKTMIECWYAAKGIEVEA